MDARSLLTRVGIALGWLTAVAFLIAGVPLFLRMPPWCDLTLYEMAARAVMAGGTHYRDIFDTNLPGFVWCLVGVRRLFGPSLLAVRAVDLVIVLAIGVLLLNLARKAGATPLARSWFAAALAALYPFTGEFCHCQRDVWMTLPILAACRLRLVQLEQETATRRGRVTEGMLWGLAVWIKPHVLLVAAAVWWATRRGRPDLRGNLQGGLIVGAAGFAWLIATDTLGPFVEVMTRWNNRYLMTIWGDLPALLTDVWFLFKPWSLLHLAAVPLAIRRWKRPPTPASRLLCTLYLALMAEACFAQRWFDYVHLPPLFLAMAVVATHSWRWFLAGFLMIAFCPLWQSPIDASRWTVRHPVWNANRRQNWSECFAAFDPPADRIRQQRVALNDEFFAGINAAELGDIADWLKSQNVREGDVIAWHDSPHAVYLELNHAPRFRFMHITTTLISADTAWRMTRELRKNALPSAKYLVTDLLHTYRSAPPEAYTEINTQDALGYPVSLPAKVRAAFPYCLPVVYRSGGGTGRYIVHEVQADIVARLDARTVPFEFEVNFWK